MGTDPIFSAQRAQPYVKKPKNGNFGPDLAKIFLSRNWERIPIFGWKEHRVKGVFFVKIGLLFDICCEKIGTDPN